MEMQIDKGSDHVTIDDIKNLMDLYTQAIEYYSSTQQVDRQKYYEKQLRHLMVKPVVKAVQSMAYQPEEEKKEYDDGEVKTRVYGAITPKSNEAPQKSIQELLKDSEDRKNTNADKMDEHKKTRDYEEGKK